MQTMITLSSKGQLTLPVEVRRKLRIQTGDKLLLKLDQAAQTATLAKPVGIEELSTRLTSYIKPGAKPVTDVDEYYQKHRREHVR
ncbi:MAG TPA: AbrB/MazE/SpoVT family DNA-binding domain-containing protein [Patescibacteria group bacterium]|jgi:AbrB family looped-hinge helix DNA binding protein|nr:AbrB/MazE/SpoVT family DNA-binding domain-containing protein [Patescibacteria group bacterium]